MKRGVLYGLIALLVVVIAVCGYQIYGTVNGYREGRETYENLAGTFVAETADSEAPEADPAPEGNSAPETEEETDPSVMEEDRLQPPITVDFDALLAENPDVVGWIYSEGTVINYPVVQGDDNSYYLKHLIDGTYNKDGSIFVDANNRRDLVDGNTIIYGHNMKDGMMFAELLKYADQSYYEAHPVIWLLTPERNYQILLFAGYTTDSTSDTYTIFETPCQEMEEYVRQRIQKSDFTTDIRPEAEDRLVVLSTCSYSRQNARYAVHGILRPC